MSSTFINRGARKVKDLRVVGASVDLIRFFFAYTCPVFNLPDQTLCDFVVRCKGCAENSVIRTERLGEPKALTRAQ